ncbi:MAG: hypothetical protein MR355_09795 [Lachnospiraceae bacterium]|nr:hypothetical protein [Lachnospiraceae bacterium]
MSIRPIDFNGVIQRTQDVGNLKQQENAKPLVDQQNIQIEVQKEEYRQSEQVRSKENADGDGQELDAKNGDGRGYQGNQKKRKNQKQEDRVVVKGASSGFDIKI